MMRRYHAYTPEKKANFTPLKQWRPNLMPVANDTAVNKEKNSAMNTDNEEKTVFTLKTSAGELNFKPSDYTNYTDFLRVVIEMTMAFNSSEVDPEFKKILRKALTAYENGDCFGNDDDEDIDDDDDDDEEADIVRAAIEEATEQAQKIEEADKTISNLAKTEELRLQILSTDGNPSQVERMLEKHADMPPNAVHEALREHKPFVLQYEKAKALYVQLRMLDVTLSIKNVEPTTTKTTTKKSSAAKKRAAKAVVKKNSKTYPITGCEQLKQSDGIIND